MKNKNEGYIKASLRERLLLTELNKLIPFSVLHTTPVDSNKSYDAVIISGDTEYILEMKVRVYDAPATFFLGYMVERPKYEYLMKQHKELGLIPLYLNFFSSGGVLIWNLLECTEPKWSLKNCQANDQSLEKQMKEKEVGDLLTSEAHHYDLWLPVVAASEKAYDLYNKYEKTFK